MLSADNPISVWFDALAIVVFTTVCVCVQLGSSGQKLNKKKIV